jgi:arylsulfatase A-like enzyme
MFVHRLLIATLLLAMPLSAPASEKPNIIFIMADDLGYADLGCYGQKTIQTPNLDRMASEGIQFTDFYSGCCKCAPARSVLMTGQHMGHTWIRGNKDLGGGRVPLRSEDITVAEVLKKAGYTAGAFGKWGLGEPGTSGVPNRQGFAEWFGYLNQKHAHSYYADYLWRNETRYELPGNRGERRQQYTHHLITAEALNFVERHKDETFFLYLPYTVPHADYEIPSADPYTNQDWPEKLKNYAAMVTLMDRDIGLLLDTLDRVGLDEKTIVLFCSDNGPAFVDDLFDSNGPLRGGKSSLYEGGIRVPMIVRWPGKVPAGRTSNQVWGMWDFLPTAAELAGVMPPDHIDGISMVNALMGEEQEDHAFVYWEFLNSRGFAQAVRMGPWKGVRTDFGPLELYDLDEDIGETTNIANRHRDIVGRIEGHMETSHVESSIWPSRR